MKYYSKSTRGFYTEEIHNKMPEDVVSITDDLYNNLHIGQSNGKIISFDDTTQLPILIDPTIDPHTTIRTKQQEATNYLNSTDWYYIRKLETSVAIPDDIVTKRAEARLLLNQ